MIRAVIFDLDGTLADTISAIREGINLTMQKHGFAEHTDDEVRGFINNGARELVRRAIPISLQNNEDVLTQIYNDYNAYYGTTYLHTDTTYAGIPEVITALSKKGLKIAVLSNKQDPYVKELCRQLLPEGSYDAAQGVIIGKPTKPHPYLSELVAAELGVNTAECVMVGDSDVDVKTAHAAGMAHVGVSWGYRSSEFLRENGAKQIADSPAELLKIIETML